MIDLAEIQRIVFVCHGNICRSPMAECIMAQLLAEAGLDFIEIESKATSTEEIGNSYYPPALAMLRRHGIEVRPHRACQLSKRDYAEDTLFIGMDSANIINMKRILGTSHNCVKLLDFANRVGEDVADPWYTDDFTLAYKDIDEGCRALLEQLKKAMT